jgi:acyl carrier protein
MSREVVEQKVAGIVCRLANLEDVSPEQDYFDAGLASVQALELLLEVESEFGVSLSDEQFAEARSVRDLAGVIAQQEGWA